MVTTVLWVSNRAMAAVHTIIRTWKNYTHTNTHKGLELRQQLTGNHTLIVSYCRYCCPIYILTVLGLWGQSVWPSVCHCGLSQAVVLTCRPRCQLVETTRGGASYLHGTSVACVNKRNKWQSHSNKVRLDWPISTYLAWSLEVWTGCTSRHIRPVLRTLGGCV